MLEYSREGTGDWWIHTFSHVSQLREELIELLLAIGEFSTTAVVDAETVHDTVDDEEAVLVAGEGLGERVEQFELVLV